MEFLGLDFGAKPSDVLSKDEEQKILDLRGNL